ncbi:hypothetical protein [Pseudanabaena sp. Chao 1811]|uniref:hypothetical protein n=1 Tax=Pseudanabaena sp. Chao 1811 TaxID=2963092 RepID=UPI0022F3BF52|nr:hypothetical protein [Pseudanabaena sp. Chao 1811]
MSAIANSNQPEDKPKTSRVQAYWRNIPWKKLTSLVMAIALCFYLTACGGDNKPVSKAPVKKIETVATNIVEVSPPTEIQRLSRLLERYEPQVSIVSPKPDEVLNSDQVAVKFDVKNLPIFKNADFGLGPHIHVTLDNQEYKALYDLNQTTTFENLSPGTHTIRAFASRPWHESFKNKGAYAQVSFNVLTKTGENTPDAKTPLLTYSRPVGTYGAEPVMLDFYLQNAPLHLLDKDEPTIDDWQVRATINGQSFTFDRWEPIYLKGLKSGKNWVKLELLEDDGDTIPNVFNSTAHVINFQPNGTDTLSRLVRGEKIANIEAIVNPNYVPPTPEPTPTPVVVTPVPAVTPAKVEATPQPVSPAPTATPQAAVKTEEVKPADKAPASVVPVVPVVVPVVPAPVVPVTPAPIKVTPIAPVKVKSEPVVTPVKITPAPNRVVPATEPIKVAPIIKSAPLVEPIKTVPVVKPEPVVTPVKSEPVRSKYAPFVRPTPVAEPIKVDPVLKTTIEPVKTKAVPVVKSTPEPVKISPTLFRGKSAPVAPSVTTTNTTKEPVPVAPKSEPAIAPEPAKDNEIEKATNKLKNYFQNFSFKRTASPANPEVKADKSEDKVAPVDDKKSTLDTKPETKSTDTAPALTDLSTTTSAPIKVLTKSGK